MGYQALLTDSKFKSLELSQEDEMNGKRIEGIRGKKIEIQCCAKNKINKKEKWRC